MSWGLVLALAAGAYAFKVLGFLVFSGRQLPARLDRCLARGVNTLDAAVLERGASDHHPIVLDLSRAAQPAGSASAAAPAP